MTRYHNNITNLINTNAAGTSYTNVGEAITSGYEAFASAAVTDRLRLRTDYTYTKAIDAMTELELLRRPRHKYTLAAELNPTDQLLLSASWLRVSTWIDGNRDFSIQRLTAPRLCRPQSSGQLHRQPIHDRVRSHRQPAQRALSEPDRLRPPGSWYLRRDPGCQSIVAQDDRGSRPDKRMFATVRCRRLILTAVALLSAMAHLGATDAPGKPGRIVSLNMCVDELVLRLAEPQNIASVTWLSRDPKNSNVAELGARIPVNHGLAEEIIPLNPDLIIAGIYTARTAVAMLKRVGIPVLEIGVPKSLDDVRAQIREIAGRIGERERGESVVADMDRRLAALPHPPSSDRPRAVVLNPNGATVGKGTLVDEIMTRAGLTNVAAELGIDSYGQIPLEAVAANAVDVLIVSASRDGPPALATQILRHPVLAALSDRTRVVVMPGRLWNCGGPAVVEAIERLIQIATEVRAEAQPK